MAGKEIEASDVPPFGFTRITISAREHNRPVADLLLGLAGEDHVLPQTQPGSQATQSKCSKERTPHSPITQLSPMMTYFSGLICPRMPEAFKTTSIGAKYFARR